MNPHWPQDHPLSDESLQREICDPSKTGLRAVLYGKNGENLGTATAFAVKRDPPDRWIPGTHSTTLVTSLHSVSGVDVYSREPGSHGVPHTIGVTVYFTDKSFPEEVVLPLRGSDDEPLWREVSGHRTFDIACVDVPDHQIVRSRVFRADIWTRGRGAHHSLAGLFDPFIRPGDPVVVSAFPLGDWSLGVFPLVLQGAMASPLDNHASEFGGPPGGSSVYSEGFLIDCGAAGAGCEGALVYTWQKQWTTRTGFDVEFDYPVAIPLGVYAHPIRPGSQVGHVIPVPIVRDLVRHGRPPGIYQGGVLDA